jgi:hypothetical protein
MAGNEITVDQLRQLLGVQADLRQQAESRWQQAQRTLVTLLESFAPEEVERRLKSGQPLDSMRVDELGQLIKQQFTALLRKALELKNESGNGGELPELKSQILTIHGEMDRIRAENRHLAAETQSLKEERDRLVNQLAALQQVSTSQAQSSVRAPNGHHPTEGIQQNSAPEPDWMISWRNAETFKRDSNILSFLGETGLARRPLIEARAAELLGIKKAGGSIRALISRLAVMQVIEIFRPWEADGAGSGGRYPDLVRLTERGQIAYWLFTGTNPKDNEYDLLLKRHVSPEHTLLNLQAADVLREAGYQVNQTPPDIHLPNDGSFKPDLALIEDQGALMFVEVERDTDKNVEQRRAKWRNFHQASGGKMYVVCDNRSCMRNIRSEINYYLKNKQLVVSLTNLADLQTGKRGEGDSVWLEARIRR